MKCPMCDLIAQYGWSVMYVFDNASEVPAFHYTVGLAARGLPELIIYGVEQSAGHVIVNDLAQRLVDNGEAWANGKVLDDALADDYVLTVVDCTERAPAFLAETIAEEMAPDLPYRVQQLITPDRENRMPWEPDYNGLRYPVHGAP